jgi:hypothetical protein
MDEIARNATPESPAADAGRWIGRLLIAVILGEGIWGLIVSLTHNLILPLLAKTMGSDVQSPLYLGKGDVNVPALFTSVLELCFAGIVAVVLNAGIERKAVSTRSKPVRVTVGPARPAPALTPVKAAAVPPPVIKPAPALVAPIPAPAQSVTPSAPSPSSGQFWSPPEPSPQPKASAPPSPKPPARPAKPKPPKEVYYNIVGEPINPTEDE